MISGNIRSNNRDGFNRVRSKRSESTMMPLENSFIKNVCTYIQSLERLN